jgi:hypothetical protein
MKITLAAWVHVHMFGVSEREPSAFGKNGPNSEKRPPLSDEQPGPLMKNRIVVMVSYKVEVEEKK